MDTKLLKSGNKFLKLKGNTEGLCVFSMFYFFPFLRRNVGLKNQFPREKFVSSRNMSVIIMRARSFYYLPTNLQFFACDAV